MTIFSLYIKQIRNKGGGAIVNLLKALKQNCLITFSNYILWKQQKYASALWPARRGGVLDHRCQIGRYINTLCSLLHKNIIFLNKYLEQSDWRAVFITNYFNLLSSDWEWFYVLDWIDRLGTFPSFLTICILTLTAIL